MRIADHRIHGAVREAYQSRICQRFLLLVPMCICILMLENPGYIHICYTHCSRVSFKVGKLVVATNELEEQRLMDLWERANKNGVPDIEIVDSR